MGEEMNYGQRTKALRHTTRCSTKQSQLCSDASYRFIFEYGRKDMQLSIPIIFKHLTPLTHNTNYTISPQKQDGLTIH